MKTKIIQRTGVPLVIILCILVYNGSLAEIKQPKNPNSAKGCALCHYRWIDTFFIEGRGSDLVEYNSEKVVATPEMCYSCHDGSVVDSRAKNVNEYGHKTGISPPLGMKIPEIFPLDEDGRIQCATCHTAHGVPGKPGSDSSIFMRTFNNNSQMCAMCHGDLDGGIKKGNHPLAPAMQKVPEKKNPQTAAKGNKMQPIKCETCHLAHGSKYESFLSNNPANSGFCLECHSDKNIITDQGKREPFHVINLKPVTAKIPGELISMGAKLGNDGEIVCRTCHKVHKNKTGPKLLLIKNDENSGLCLTCHRNKQFMVNTKHNLSLTAPKEKNLQGKTVKETGLCSACHLPHKPARKLTGNKDMTTRICLSCHDKGNIAQKVNLSGKTHPLKMNPFKKRNNTFTTIHINQDKFSLPLFNKLGVEDKNGDMTCTTCHATHGSTEESGKSPQNKFFLRKNKPYICKECHIEKFAIADSQHDLKKSAPAAKNILNQTVMESGLCGSCHLVHGSTKDFLWARKIDPDDAKSDQRLCISCHNKNGIAKTKVNKGYSHPLNIPAGHKFADLDLPLFNKTGEYSINGDLTCYTCHDPHIPKDRNKLKTISFLRKNPPFLCRNCHIEKFDIVNSSHDLSGKNRDPKEESSKGPLLCKTCHLVHNAWNSFLWAKNISMDNECISCHNEQGIANKKLIKGFSHPVNISPIEKGVAVNLPLYDKTGNKSQNGVMKCYTCHDAHQGNAVNSANSPDSDHKKEIPSKFLRLENSPSPLLCSACHKDKGRIAGTDHDLVLSSPESKNILNQTPVESGTCGVCHLVHNSKNQYKFWARNFGNGKSIDEQTCNACHSENGSAKKKIPQISSHPKGKLIKNIGRNIKDESNFFPLFNQKTGEYVNTGNISCSSCHNIHQWTGKQTSVKIFAHKEGDALSSFLRPPGATRMCKDCHGLDALFRFKYFHSENARKTGKD